MLLQRNAMERKVFYGNLNNGTVSVAEIMAFVAPLMWYAAQRGRNDIAVKHVHILTDSQYVQSRGSAGASGVVGKHAILWSALSMIERQGYTLHWHWKPRDTTGLNRYVDAISRAARLVMETQDVIPAIAAKTGMTAQTANPWQ